MSNPLAVNPGGVLQTPGIGNSIGDGIAGVLAAMQQSRENQQKQAIIQNEMAQQQAQQAYYEGLIRQQQAELNYKAGSDALARAGLQQVGAVERAALTSGQTQGNVFRDALSGGQLAGQTLQALQGVSDENIPAAVKGIGEVQSLQPKAPELPTSAKEFQFLQYLQAADPSGRLAQGYALWHRQQAPQTNVNLGAGPSEFAKADQKNQADQLGVFETDAKKAFNGMPAMTAAYNLLRSGKPYTGLGAGLKLQAGRIASALGVPDATVRTGSTQELLNLTGQQVVTLLASRALGSGTAVSDADRGFMEGQAGRDLSQNPAALKSIMRINFGTALMKQHDAIEALQTAYAAAAQSGDKAEMGSLQIRLKNIQARYDTAWAQYAKMAAETGVSPQDILERAKGSGVSDPARILVGLPTMNIRQMGDSIFGGR